MRLTQLEGRHRRLLHELRVASSDRVEHAGQVQRLKDELSATERELAKLHEASAAAPIPHTRPRDSDPAAC
jgi:hypothetical protein